MWHGLGFPFYLGIQRETIIRIRIRTPIIRIRITNARIVRIIRITGRQELVTRKTETVGGGGE